MITLTQHHILIQPVEKMVKKTASGIIIPDSIYTKELTASDIGIVLQIGPTAVYNETAAVCVGDKVGFIRYSGKTIQDIDGETYIIVNDEDILCVLSEDDTYE